MHSVPCSKKWIKRGLIYKPDGRYGWACSYAQKPNILVLSDRLRVYYACRPAREDDGSYTSVTSFIDVDIDNPSDILYIHDKPVMNLGGPGAFDQHAVIPGCILHHGDELLFYYIGWMRLVGVPYSCALGLARSRDGGETFQRVGMGPLLGRTLSEPFFVAGAYIVSVNGQYHMWYSSGTDWIRHEGRMESIYVLMHAVSNDGINWKRDAVPCVPSTVSNECQGFASVMPDGDKYHLWYCWRHPVGFRDAARGYRIGHAWSEDLVVWHRDGNQSLDVSSCGWDSEMVCYPCVVRAREKIFMFYSGNYFGREGLGYAELC
jgi:predicted GH43/DUF377 family glycosyl hydrolase